MIEQILKKNVEQSRLLGAGQSLWDALGRQAKESRIIQWFLQVREIPAISKNSIFTRLIYGILDGCSVLFDRLHLTAFLRGSIFVQPAIWCILAAALAPVLPTMAVLALVMVSFGTLFLRLVCKKERIRYHILTKYVLLYALVYAISTLFSVSFWDSLYGGALSVAFMLFFVVVIHSVNSEKKSNVMLFLMVTVGAVVALYGFYQYANPAQFSGVWVDQDMFSSITFRVYSTLGNPNVLGEYFLLVLPFAASLFLTSKNWQSRVYFLICGCMMLLCLVLTYSRGCYLGFLVSVAAFLVLLDKRFLLLGILGLFALPFVLPETILDRFLSIGNMADSSTSYRVNIWLGTIDMLKDYWFSGIGPGMGAYNKVYPFYAYNSVSAPHSHNLFLQILCDTGICGLLVFAAMIWMFYRIGFQGVSVEKRFGKKLHLIAGISAISGFLVQSLSDYTFYNYRVMLAFWAVLGLTMVFGRRCMRSRTHKKETVRT